MKRRNLLRGAGLATGATLLARPARAFVPAHNWDRYDWGAAPSVTDRLYQGPFPEELVRTWDVVMAPTPSADVVPNFGMGLMTYVWDETGQKKTPKSLEQSIEDLVKYPLGTLVYIRVDWRHVHKAPGRLDPDPHWKLTFDAAKRCAKRVAFRVQLGNPDIPGLAMPEFVDTMMYGFWGEGHTWPFVEPRHPFPDDAIAEATLVAMFEAQRKAFPHTPLATNTQPDWSRVGNRCRPVAIGAACAWRPRSG